MSFSMENKFLSDEIEVGIRKSDNSRWVKFYMGEQEQNKMVWAGLSTMIGQMVVYNVSVDTEGRD